MCATMELLDELDARGLVHGTTDRAALARRLAGGPIRAYVGFDPSADSLHVGNLLGQIMLRRFQLAGHRPVVLAGGATGMVGDPSGRSSERNLLDQEALAHNLSCIRRQLERLLDFEPGPSQAVLVDNAEWTAPMGVLDFLRDVGKHVTVNQMLARETVKARLASEHGISYTEFSYMLLQANDYRHLCEHLDVELQMGGSDQWGNIVAGADLIRRTLGRHVHALTWPLVTRRDGTKFGKSVEGAVWLDGAKTSPYQFRQFWLQSADDDIGTYLMMFSLRPLDEVRALIAEHAGAPERRVAQRALAHELTALLHGDEAARAADEAADVLFGADPTAASEAALEVVAGEVPSSRRPRRDLDDPMALLVACGLASSNGDARRTLQQGGYRANGVRLGAFEDLAGVTHLHGRWLLLRRGKTQHHLVEVFEA
jgi:tyrosyl-tRNA synthetase